MKKTLYTAALALSVVLPVQAQELSGSLTVEGAYNPVIRNHDRLSGLPSRFQGELPQSSLPASLAGRPTQVVPGFAQFLTADPDMRLPHSYDGYVSLLAGSYLNSSLSAGYRFVNTSETTLGAWLQHNSSSLYRPGAATATEGECPRRKVYDETLGMYASHSLGDAGTISGKLVYHLGYFNYYTDRVNPLTALPYDAPTQTLNDLGLDMMWDSAFPQSRDWAFSGEVGYRYFGYRRFYQNTGVFHGLTPSREHSLTPGLTAEYKAGGGNTVGITAHADLLFYSGGIDEAFPVPSVYPVPVGSYGNYGIFGLAPRWTFSHGPWSIRAGARADFSWGIAGFSSVHIAPDAAVSYSASHITIDLSATGGVTPNTLAANSELDMYQAPALISTTPLYTPVNAMLKVSLGDFRGFAAYVQAGYAVADNTPVTGWYPYNLFGVDPFPGKKYESLAALSLRGFTLGAGMSYTLGSLLDAAGSVTYQRQSGRDGYYNGPDRPRWTADVSASVSPLAGLKIGAGYEYRGVRTLYLARNIVDTSVPPTPDHNFDGDSSILGVRLPDITNLRAFASYTLDKRYTFSVEARNILGGNESLSPLMPSDGLNILGGVSILF